MDKDTELTPEQQNIKDATEEINEILNRRGVLLDPFTIPSVRLVTSPKKESAPQDDVASQQTANS